MSVEDVGRRLRDLRIERGLSLSELARRAGIGKGSLSEIEGGGRNPTVETLYALCGPLEVPMTSLIGESPGAVSVAQGGMRSILLSVRTPPTLTVEVFRLEFPTGAGHISPGHRPGTREHLTVVAGVLRVGPTGREREVGAGDSHTWSSDGSHRYTAIDGPAEAVLVITTPR
ncbi:helix-turn-helix domain-containing protein [Williamsia sterculiae]|uniref:Helix-turn-helix domain-containing protein n=1 Tax=Williamsia sterculiae TaxID=1344003 RepID=A0A1N7F3X9_9NOCA|nr:XRE family transcriptional regulator [Williamsia sterculiae]SIR95077.1 Helix-turn-helix domain-containing protein [Williamsia sterculiae]